MLAGTVSLGTLFVFINYISSFFEPIQELAEQFGTLQSSLASAEKIFAILDEKPEIVNPESKDGKHVDRRAENGKGHDLAPVCPEKLLALIFKFLISENPRAVTIQGRIEFRHVWFAYEKDDYILKDVSCKDEHVLLHLTDRLPQGILVDLPDVHAVDQDLPALDIIIAPG